MVGQDFVSGAMENTTSTLHGPWAQQNARKLTDGNAWEVVVAHELFHHWFGDLVTAESWSNLTVNESFADYSEYLWTEYKYGRDAADAYHMNAMQGYLNNPNDKAKHLVRFYYRDKEEMFDQVSYQKGGRILHMLRYELGDSAFFKGIGHYLQQNKFKAAEAHQLRLALEEVSGRDLNPFFNQWYFNSGHPEVSISYGTKDGKDYVAFEQKQKDRLFSLPIKIAAYSGNEKPDIHSVMVSNEADTFYFDNKGKTTFYEADADRIMLWKKSETKTSEQWVAQYKRKANFISRAEALNGQLSLDTLGETTRQLMLSALSDPYHDIAAKGLRYFVQYSNQLKTDADWALVEKLARNEKDRPTRAAAIEVLARRNPTTDSSYTVAGAALNALTENNTEAAMSLSAKLKEDADGDLASALAVLEIAGSKEADAGDVIANFKTLPGMERIGATRGMCLYAANIKDPATFKNVLAPVMDIYRRIPAGFGTYKSDILMQMKSLLAKKEAALTAQPGNAELKDQIEWLKNQIQ
jgi:aminopeptidase N